jgi:hypothetical protein
MDRDKELDELVKIDRLIAEADRRIRDLESTMRGSSADWHSTTKAEDLLATMRLNLVRYKARRAAIVQFMQDMEAGRF